LDELARERLRDCEKATEATPVQRYLWLTAVRVLDSLRRLRSEDLVPFLPHMTAQPIAKDDPRGDLARQVERLVNEVAEGLSPQRQHERLDRILDVIVEKALNPRITAATRTDARETIG